MNKTSKIPLTGYLADFFLSSGLEKIPPHVIQKARTLTADTIGVGLNGSAHSEGSPIYNVMLESGGSKESVVWGHHAKIPAHAAAFVNGTFAHCIELDDTHRMTYLHAGAFVVPAALAVAEKLGTSGKEFLYAVIAGYETAIRIALSVSPEHRLKGYHTTATVGVFGSAMAASLLLNLDRQQIINALGLAGTQSAGLFQFLYDGSMAKRFHPGRSAQSGILAALLAEKGFTGPEEILEGPYGFGRVMSDKFDPGKITHKLGEHWHITEMGIKPYAACRFCHGPIDGALEIRQDPNFDLQSIESVEVLGSQQLFDQTGNQTPETVMGAQLSTPFMVALALATGKVMPIDVEKGVDDPLVKIFAKRVQVVVDSDLPINSREVQVKTISSSGRIGPVSVKLPTGEPEKPLSDEYLKEKFYGLSSPIIGKDTSKLLYKTLLKVDELEEIRLLSSWLMPDKQAILNSSRVED